MKIKLFLFENARDNIVSEDNSLELDWSEMIDLFCGDPIIREEKEGEAFIACDFDTSENARPLVRVFEIDNKRIESPRKFNNELLIGRYADNVQYVHAICLDFDNGITIDEAKDNLKGIKHLGYTSWSHMHPGKGERFRVVIPLKEPCPANEWAKRKKSLRETWPDADGSFTDLSRIMYLPSCHPDYRDVAHSWHHDGEICEYTWFDEEEPPPPPKPIDRTNLSKGNKGKVVWETLDLKQFMIDQGFYIKQQAGNKHAVCCPNYKNHSHQARGGTFITTNPDKRDAFWCSHTSCTNGKFNFWTDYFNKLDFNTRASYCEREPESPTIQIQRLLAEIRKGKK